MAQCVRIFAIGDIVGPAGCACLEACLPDIKKSHNIDVVIANGENSAQYSGVSHEAVARIMGAGVDVITTGNHAFKNPNAAAVFEKYPYLLRPANFHKTVPGAGSFILDKGGYRVCVINLIGNTFMRGSYANPYDTIDEILAQNQGKAEIFFVDFHAEATAEKKALAFYLDGRVTALVGTHTHIQTADEQILPNGTAYITDLGMTGPALSVLGVRPELAIKTQISGLPVRFETADGPCEICGVILQVALEQNKPTQIERFRLVYPLE